MALNAYLQGVQRLCWDFKEEVLRINDLTAYINTARGQIAGESESIRAQATLTTTANQQIYDFSNFSIYGTGITGILNIRMLTATVNGTVYLVDSYPWEWFNAYFICQSPAAGTPTVWSQYNFGSMGSIFLGPTPNAAILITADCICYPVPLVNDATAEALPYPWTDAVIYYAAYQAALTAQKMDTAANFFIAYEKFVERARQFSTPSVLAHQYPQNTLVGRPAPLGIIGPQVGMLSGGVFPGATGIGGGGQKGG